jgi:hypothetical protein
MKKTVSKKKISIKKETITRLNSKHLETIAGGNNTPITKGQTSPAQCITAAAQC